MIRFACCIPGGSLMPEGVASVPKSPAEQLVKKCRYLLDIGYDSTECAGITLAALSEEDIAYLIRENKARSLGLIAVNSMFPMAWKLADPAQDKTAYIAHAVKIFDIMRALDIPYAILGSGHARSLLSDQLQESREALLVFLKTISQEAGKRGIQILIEPLRKSETNIFISVPEAGDAIREINDPNILLLYDAFHMAEEGTDLSCVQTYAPLVRHCHISESPKRSYPGCENSADLSYNRRFAAELLAAGYDGTVSVECGFEDFEQDSLKALTYLKKIFSPHTVFTYRAIRTICEEPVYLEATEGTVSPAITALVCGDKTFPASPAKNGVIAILSAEKDEELILTACEEEVKTDAQIIPVPEESRVDVLVQGNAFASYRYSTDIPKPFFGPILDNAGNTFTRPDINHPEHKHQRSVFIAVGDVNGVDCWNEHDRAGYVRTQEITDIYSGTAYATFTVKNLWKDENDNPLLHETTRYTVYNQSENCRTLDIAITFSAEFGQVTFGPTKEAGPFGIRVRDEMRGDIGTGQLSNSWGAIGENEAWGRCAQWCTYAADIDGIGTMNITVFDDEKNERHPTAWHIRNYGLFAANNLHFKGGLTIADGESLTYRFRILFGRKPLSRDDISDKYIVYTLGSK